MNLPWAALGRSRLWLLGWGGGFLTSAGFSSSAGVRYAPRDLSDRSSRFGFRAEFFAAGVGVRYAGLSGGF